MAYALMAVDQLEPVVFGRVPFVNEKKSMQAKQLRHLECIAEAVTKWCHCVRSLLPKIHVKGAEVAVRLRGVEVDNTERNSYLCSESYSKQICLKKPANSKLGIPSLAKQSIYFPFSISYH